MAHRGRHQGIHAGNGSFRYATRQMSEGLKSRARGSPVARYGRSRGGPLPAPSPTTGVLHRVVRAHLTEFLAAVDAQTDGSGLPGFIVNEFRKFLRSPS